MTSGQLSERRLQRREQILGASWDIANEQGLGAVTLHEVARRVQIKQPSLYGYVDSKLGLFDLMFRQAYEHLLARLDADPPLESPRDRLLQLSRTILDFVVENPPRQQLLFQRTIPGFEPSADSYAVAVELIVRTRSLLADLGADTPAQIDVYTAIIAGLGSQQVANDPQGTRWTQHLEVLLDLFLNHFSPEEPAP